MARNKKQKCQKQFQNGFILGKKDLLQRFSNHFAFDFVTTLIRVQTQVLLSPVDWFTGDPPNGVTEKW